MIFKVNFNKHITDMKIALGSDHAGVEYKKAIVEHLKNKGIETQDFGRRQPKAWTTRTTYTRWPMQLKKEMPTWV